MPRAVRVRKALLMAESEVPDAIGNVGAVHRKVYLVRRLVSGGLKMLQHLEKQCQLRNRVLARKHEGMTLGLAEFMTQLGDNVKLQSSVRRKLLSQ